MPTEASSSADQRRRSRRACANRLGKKRLLRDHLAPWSRRSRWAGRGRGRSPAGRTTAVRASGLSVAGAHRDADEARAALREGDVEAVRARRRCRRGRPSAGRGRRRRRCARARSWSRLGHQADALAERVLPGPDLRGEALVDDRPPAGCRRVSMPVEVAAGQDAWRRRCRRTRARSMAMWVTGLVLLGGIDAPLDGVVRPSTVPLAGRLVVAAAAGDARLRSRGASAGRRRSAPAAPPRGRWPRRGRCGTVEQVRRIEPQVERSFIVEHALDHQPGADQQQAGEGHLADDHDAAEAGRAGRLEVPRPSSLSTSFDVGPRGLERRQEAGEHGREQRHPEGEEQGGGSTAMLDARTAGCCPRWRR